MNETFEFDDMRQQMQTLKQKLQQQEIVNDRMIRHSMKKTVGSINRRYLVVMIICVLMIPYSYWAFVQLNGFSLAFWIFTCAVMLVCLGGTLYNKLKLNESNMMTRNLLDVRRSVASAKKFDVNWLFLAVPMILVFLGWFMYEAYQMAGGSLGNGLLWGGCIGAVIGAIFGFSLHYRTQTQYQEIIDQIEDLTGEE
jgi:hypothetical protein